MVFQKTDGRTAKLFISISLRKTAQLIYGIPLKVVKEPF